MIELLIALMMNDAIHDFGLLPFTDYDPIEVIYYATLTPSNVSQPIEQVKD